MYANMMRKPRGLFKMIVVILRKLKTQTKLMHIKCKWTI